MTETLPAPPVASSFPAGLLFDGAGGPLTVGSRVVRNTSTKVLSGASMVMSSLVIISLADSAVGS